MTLLELYQKCIDDKDLCNRYIKQYEQIIFSIESEIGRLEFKDVCSFELSDYVQPRHKGMAVAIIKQSIKEHHPKIVKARDIITRIKDIRSGKIKSVSDII